MVIASRDPFESRDVDQLYDLAAGIVREGNEVTVFLVQNGVLPARFGARSEGLTKLSARGVKVLADEFSLRERAIGGDQLVSGVTPSPLDVIVDHLAAGGKALWH